MPGIEWRLRKSNIELGKLKSRSARAESQATQLQGEIDRSKVNAKTIATQLENAQRVENVMGEQVNNLKAKIKSLEKEIVHHETQI